MHSVGRWTLGVACLLLAGAVAQALDTVDVVSVSASARTGPGTGYASVGTVHRGEAYVRVNQSGAWSQVWFATTTAWVQTPAIAVSSRSKRTVTAQYLNVRSGPGTGYSVVGSAQLGSWWVVRQTSGGWSQVWFKGTTRWMSSTYLADRADDPYRLPYSRVGFVQLPASGAGFYGYNLASARWGKPVLVYGFLRTASRWRASGTLPRIGVGDLSLVNGGPISGHVSHRLGEDMDLRLVAQGSYEGPLLYTSRIYSQSRTRSLIVDFLNRDLPVEIIFFNDPVIANALSYVSPWPNHDNHMHVRLK